ncbi:hypothetical protein PQR52_00140 [Paraburkholderia aspalathi]|uniref:hypothetical protein n=1 Tax=Paraburkholderia aspalathi TaxID=1324617 RepID=UPI0038BAD6B8
MIVFTVAISPRFPLWFVMLSATVNGTTVTYFPRCLASRVFLHMAGHTKTASDPALAWSSA